MKNLIEALQIFLKYGNPNFPTHCEHDELWVYGYDVMEINGEDVERLEKLGFVWNEDYEGFVSSRYGSC